MRHFIRQSIKAGRCISPNQYTKSSSSDEVFNNISTEINITSNTCEILDKYFEDINNHRTRTKHEYNSQLEDY